MEPDPDARPPDDALRDRIGREYPTLRRMITALVRKTLHHKHVDMMVDEVAQETVCACLKSAARFEQARPIVPWMMGFAINILKARRRANATDAKRLVGRGGIDDRFWDRLASLQRTDDGPSDDLEAMRARVRVAIGRLDVEARKAIYYRFFEGIDGSDLARALGVGSTATARVRTFRAVRKLKGLLVSSELELVSATGPGGEAP